MSLFCLPSNQETAPLVISEAMASGKPVVASNICGIPYMIRDSETGFLFDPDDAYELSEKISKIMTDEKLRIRMGKNARSDALKRWHPDIIAEKTYKLYEDIL